MEINIITANDLPSVGSNIWFGYFSGHDMADYIKFTWGWFSVTEEGIGVRLLAIFIFDTDRGGFAIRAAKYFVLCEFDIFISLIFI